MSENEVGFAVLGAGTVGGALLKYWAQNREFLDREIGAQLSLKAVAVKQPAKSRPQWIPQDAVTTDIEGQSGIRM